MSAITNLTNLTGASNFYEVTAFANDSTGGILIIMFVVSLFVIFMGISIRRYDLLESVLASSFLLTMISIFLVANELLNFIFAIVFSIVMAFSALYLYMVKR